MKGGTQATTTVLCTEQRQMATGAVTTHTTFGRTVSAPTAFVMNRLCVYCEVRRNFSNVYKRNIGFRVWKIRQLWSICAPGSSSMLTCKWTHNADVACVRSFSSKTAMFNVLKLCSGLGCNFALHQSYWDRCWAKTVFLFIKNRNITWKYTWNWYLASN